MCLFICVYDLHSSSPLERFIIIDRYNFQQNYTSREGMTNDKSAYMANGLDNIDVLTHVRKRICKLSWYNQCFYY